MCGIAGIIGENLHRENLHRENLRTMLLTQQHRGPDATGIWEDTNVLLGHNRLAIIDLSSEANQPMHSSCGRYTIVFNGEIYNYIELKKELSHYNFTTNSDTEVLLAAYIHWGKDCLQHLNGMFAFAIWDQLSQTLFAARDRFGVKPFYYTIQNEQLYFASEIKSLHAAGIPKKPNETVWASYFVYGSYGMPNETFWESICQLPAGHCLTYRNNQLKITKWYFFEEAIQQYQNLHFTEHQVKEQYLSLLKDSIHLRFRADVPVGFNVSGGLDSSVLLAMVHQQANSDNVEAFTFYTNDERYDELPWVAAMIAITQNPLNKVLLSPDADLVDKITLMGKMQDEPFGGIPTVAYSQIFKEARKKGVYVLLDGQGMDEQWAGYDYYRNQSQEIIQGVQTSPFRPQVLSERFLAKAVKPNYPKRFKEDLLNKQYRDLFYTKIPRALRFNDRVSMAYSTELREPFLDHRLVEFAFAQPEIFKIKNGTQKYLLRQMVAEMLNDNIVYAPKRPLQTPQREWLQKDLKTYVAAQINLLEKSSYASWFNFEELKKEWQTYQQETVDSSFHIWQWLNTSILTFE